MYWLNRVIVVPIILLLGARSAAAQAVNVDPSGLALSGYDPVAYFVEGRAVKGSPEITTTYQGASYRFSAAGARSAFETEPDRYLPAYGGYCAYGVANGHKVKIDPEAFRVVAGRLYLNYSKGVQRRWLSDIPGNIAAADRNWDQLRDKPHD